ncbi:MAG: SPOR domain-containing protein [Candidatus Glassbacteria bacterium]|nr:SPOR domain-containing protein [Candidatus Glassbacteria bacterium]
MALLLGITGGGCSVLRSLKEIRSGGQKEPERPAEAASRMDSLWQAQLPADTILLAPRPENKAAVPEGLQLGPREPGFADLGTKAAVPGYRVQLASSERREELEPLMIKVESEMKTAAYLELHSDRYTLRIGDFRNKAEADAERNRAVSFGYRHAWVVQTRVVPR